MFKKIIGMFSKKKSAPPVSNISHSESKEKESNKDKAQNKPALKSRNPEKPKVKSASKNNPDKRQQKRPQTKDSQPKKREQKTFEEWDLNEFKVEPVEGKKRFHDFNLPYRLMHAIFDLKFQYCTPIQAELLGETLNGRDAFGQAQTGTGKTAAFLITILKHIFRTRLSQKPRPGTPRALILAPTRELVIQIAKEAEALSKYSRANIVSVYGGMHYKKQQSILEKERVDIVVATPGRLIDFCDKKKIHLGKVEVLVLDEADRMLDMGFIPDVRKIVGKTPKREERQTLFFSATLSDRVKRLASSWTKNPVIVSIDPEQVTVDLVDQKFYLVESSDKMPMIVKMIKAYNIQKSIVFCNRKDETVGVAKYLKNAGIKCEVLSGDVDQRKRLKTLDAFKSEDISILVATDIAGRGIHVDSVTYVFNYSLPDDPEDYVHRIGRTGRAGATGVSVSFAGEDDSFAIPAIEKFTGRKFNYEYPPDELVE